MLLLGLGVANGLLLGAPLFGLMKKTVIGPRERSMGTAIFSRVTIVGAQEARWAFRVQVLGETARFFLSSGSPNYTKKVERNNLGKAAISFTTEPL